MRGEWELDYMLDAVRAMAWRDAGTTGKEPLQVKLREGKHMNLPRIFKPTRLEKLEALVEEWVDEGRPGPRLAEAKMKNPCPSEIDGQPLDDDEREWMARELQTCDRSTALKNFKERRRDPPAFDGWRARLYD